MGSGITELLLGLLYLLAVVGLYRGWFGAPHDRSDAGMSTDRTNVLVFRSRRNGGAAETRPPRTTLARLRARLQNRL